MTGDAALAEDAAQEAFLRAFRAIDRYRPQSSFRAWMRTIAIRCAIDLMRRRRPEVPLSDTESTRVSEEARHEDTDHLRAALAALSPLDREIMLTIRRRVADRLPSTPDGEHAAFAVEKRAARIAPVEPRFGLKYILAFHPIEIIHFRANHAGRERPQSSLLRVADGDDTVADMDLRRLGKGDDR